MCCIPLIKAQINFQVFAKQTGTIMFYKFAALIQTFVVLNETKTNERTVALRYVFCVAPHSTSLTLIREVTFIQQRVTFFANILDN